MQRKTVLPIGFLINAVDENIFLPNDQAPSPLARPAKMHGIITARAIDSLGERDSDSAFTQANAKRPPYLYHQITPDYFQSSSTEIWFFLYRCNRSKIPILCITWRMARYKELP